MCPGSRPSEIEADVFKNNNQIRGLATSGIHGYLNIDTHWGVKVTATGCTAK